MAPPSCHTGQYDILARHIYRPQHPVQPLSDTMIEHMRWLRPRETDGLLRCLYCARVRYPKVNTDNRKRYLKKIHQ
jgi:hypothetical protein